jgi:DNA-binding transcriptional MocR family regulator
VFQIVAIPFDAFQALPCAKSRWLLTCFSRYVDKAGKAFPNLRQLARDARMSLASVSRYMSKLAALGVFQRQRKPGKRYIYQLAEAYRPRWPGRPRPAVPAPQPAVPHAATQQAKPEKQFREKGRHAESPDDSAQWRARLTAWRNSGGRFWPSFAGPRPDEQGCFAPPALVQEAL